MESGADYIGTRVDALRDTAATLLSEGTTSYGGWGLALSVWDLDAFPSEQAGID